MTELAPVFLPVVLLLASFAGWRVQRALAEHHRGRDTIEAVRLVLSMLVTFAALVLGLLTTSAKAHFDRHGAALQTYGIDLIMVDQRLREYGPPADPIRATLRAYTASAVASTWPGEPAPPGRYPTHLDPLAPGSAESTLLGAMLLSVDRDVAELVPATPVQQAMKPLLATRLQTLLQDRWTLVGAAQPTLSWPFLSVMTGWLLLVFAVFGLSAPGNRVVYVVLALAALSLSVAVWLIVELDSPLTGVIQSSSAPLREALLHMDLPGG
jgi:hypothetical protein